MKQYKLTVIIMEDNGQYESDLAKYKMLQEEKSKGYYGRSSMMESRDSIEEPRIVKYTRSLDIVLNEDEYQKVKQGVLSAFE